MNPQLSWGFIRHTRRNFGLAQRRLTKITHRFAAPAPAQASASGQAALFGWRRTSRSTVPCSRMLVLSTGWRGVSAPAGEQAGAPGPGPVSLTTTQWPFGLLDDEALGLGDQFVSVSA